MQPPSFVQPSVRVSQTVDIMPKMKSVAGVFLEAGMWWKQINYSPIDRDCISPIKYLSPNGP
jgi:hypothetical protein